MWLLLWFLTTTHIEAGNRQQQQRTADPSASSAHVIQTCSTGMTHHTDAIHAPIPCINHSCQQLWAPGVKDTRKECKLYPFLRRISTPCISHPVEDSCGTPAARVTSTEQRDSIHSQTRATAHPAPACKTKPQYRLLPGKTAKRGGGPAASAAA